jgi:hypothetical protein
MSLFSFWWVLSGESDIRNMQDLTLLEKAPDTFPRVQEIKQDWYVSIPTSGGDNKVTLYLGLLYINTSGINKVSFFPKCFPIYDLILLSREEEREPVRESKPCFSYSVAGQVTSLFSGLVCPSAKWYYNYCWLREVV